MTIPPSPLELWFTEHPGPHRHTLAMTQVQAPPASALAALLGGLPVEALSLGYSEPAGDPTLRRLITDDLGTAPAGITLTQGAVEANWLALTALIRPGARVLVQTPSYPQLACVSAALGAEVVPWQVGEETDEAEALAALDRLASTPFRLIVLNTPHNPTGRVWSTAALRRIYAHVAAQDDAYMLVDEVYRGVGETPLPPSALTCGPRAVISGSVSKGLALPGLRVGWLAGPEDVIETVIRWREHTSLALSSASEALLVALWPHRERLIADNHAILRRNRAIVRDWLAAQPGLSGQVAETAACFLLRGPGLEGDRAVAEAWYQQDQVLVIPATTIGYPGAVRIGYGHRDAAALEAALEFVSDRLKAPVGA